MSNLLSTVAIHNYYFIPLVLLLLRNFPLSSPYPNSQRHPALSNSNILKQNSKNVVDKYSSNLYGHDSDPVISSTQSSWSSFQPYSSNNKPITQIQNSNLRKLSITLAEFWFIFRITCRYFFQVLINLLNPSTLCSPFPSFF